MVLRIGTWNVQNLINNIKADRRVRKTAQVVKELTCNKMDIASQ